MSDNRNTGTVGALMLVAGGLIGAGLGILFAPQSGKKTRRKIGRYAQKVRNEAEEIIRDSAQAVTEAV
jgi:gas vesicle protein